VNHISANLACDVLVLGSGAAGLACAITAKSRGLDVVVLEKEPVFGGTTALSGGVLWVPGNSVSQRFGQKDSRADAERFMQHETGAFYDAEAVKAFLDHGPAMVDFFHNQTAMQFVPTLYPDYHPDSPGGAQGVVPGGASSGRSILAAPYDIRGLGKEMARLKPPLKTITFIGMMFNSSNADLKHFFQFTRSLTSAVYVAKRLASHVMEMLRFGRPINVTSGNALAARLAQSAFDLKIPIYTESPAKQLLTADGRCVGAEVSSPEGTFTIHTKHGVVLACGGFPHDVKRLARAYDHVARDAGNAQAHVSPTPESNTGDGLAMAEAVGGNADIRFEDSAAWMPVSLVPGQQGPHDSKPYGIFPHLLDRYKPGVIGVLKNGQRFTNESNSYHDVGAAMVRACAKLDAQKYGAETAMWLIADANTVAKYGLGYAKPAPMPLWPHVKSGYLVKGATLAELATQTGIDAATLQATVAEFNTGAANGQDPAFGRGGNAFNRYLADAAHQPNPCVAPVLKAPFYALKLVMGDLGTFDGLQTSVVGEVLKRDGTPIPGLFAAGNDRASIMGGNYPGAGITHGPNMTFGYVTGNHLADVAGARLSHPNAARA
jgi:succinate dehydrogenase/fumarate reductase flavoprotein subunit